MALCRNCFYFELTWVPGCNSHRAPVRHAAASRFLVGRKDGEDWNQTHHSQREPPILETEHPPPPNYKLYLTNTELDKGQGSDTGGILHPGGKPGTENWEQVTLQIG